MINRSYASYIVDCLLSLLTNYIERCLCRNVVHQIYTPDDLRFDVQGDIHPAVSDVAIGNFIRSPAPRIAATIPSG